MDLMYDYSYTVTNTGSKPVDITGKGPTTTFTATLEVGETYTHVESVNVCELTSVTVSFSVMGDGGDCVGEAESGNDLVPLTPAPTPAPSAICTIEVCFIVDCPVIISSNCFSSLSP